MTASTPRASVSATSWSGIGWKGDEKVGAREMKAFFELHIEQGPILEAEGIDIGVVTHGQGLALDRMHRDRQGEPYRFHPDADA